MRVIKQVQFIGSFPRKPPETDLPEIAFVGRSNVGKSSIVVRFVDDTFSG